MDAIELFGRGGVNEGRELKQSIDVCRVRCEVHPVEKIGGTLEHPTLICIRLCGQEQTAAATSDLGAGDMW